MSTAMLVPLGNRRDGISKESTNVEVGLITETEHFRDCPSCTGQWISWNYLVFSGFLSETRALRENLRLVHSFLVE